MRLFATTALVAALSTAALAQDGNTILVLDGSGSMWGQIDGVAKIGIAQDVVGTLLSDFPADQGLGLTVYGHRERGNCTDIETLVAPATGTAAAIAEAVRGIKPLGKTPMTDAIIAAAEALRYTEDKATVILVSDGVETCNPDPCAAARLLEEAGIDFTAHVIGFDVDDPEALAQMQCLADETGGQFLTAANADELNLAMSTVVQAAPPPEPEPLLIGMTFTAVMGEEKAPIDTPVLWSIAGNDGPLAEDAAGNPFLLDLPEGAYTASAYSVADEASATASFIAIDGAATTVEVVFEARKPTATVTAPATAPAGDTIEVGWKGPAEDNDFIAIRRPDAEGYHRFINTARLGDGPTVALLMPSEAGEFAIEYVLNKDRAPLAATPITVTPVAAAVIAPQTAPAGATIDVGWKGPGYANDFIAVRRPDAEGYHRFINTTAVKRGNPVKLALPSEAGTYVIEYIENQGRSPLAVAQITVESVAASVIAPAEAAAGATIDVGWKGPDYANDFIAVRRPDAEGYHRFVNTVATKRGNPAKLAMPTEPGDYVIEYIENQDRTPMAATPITVTAVAAALTAPVAAAAGETIEVTWTGPDYPNDFIAVRRPEAEGYHRFINTTATKRGNPTKLEMPAEPGSYVIEYIEAQDRSPLAMAQITLSPVTATLIVPPSAAAGAQIDIGWKGPGYRGDFVAIRKPDADGYHRFSATQGLKDGPTARLTMPDTPGTYVIEYIIGQSRAPLAAATIEVK